MNSSIRTKIAITLLPKLNNRLYLSFIERCGGIEGFFSENTKALSAICQEYNLIPESLNRTIALKKADLELKQIDKYGISILSVEDTSYPDLLQQCEDAPLVFYYKGNFQPSSHKYLAIVGTRHASERYKNLVYTIVKELAQIQQPPVIVSGLAFGIDASAHRASLKYNLKTHAVLGHGLHMIYPASHKNLAGNILESEGALISEFPCTANTHPGNFLRRNRIIAGLCHTTLVVESAIKGGAMATARIALSYNRDVLAIPGNPEDFYSAGCNLLIKNNIAALTENATDVAQSLNLSLPKTNSEPTQLKLFGSEEQQNSILNLLQEKGTLYIDELSQVSGIPSGELIAHLLQLELTGQILALPGKKYSIR